MQPHTPEHTRVYAVGDIHGRHDLLQQILGQIRADAAEYAGKIYVIFLGDYVSRGEASRQVINTLQALPSAEPTWEITCLRGNHDDIFQNLLTDGFRANKDAAKEWVHRRGGNACLQSYGVRLGQGAKYQEILTAAQAAVPAVDLAWLQQLATYQCVGGYLFVHAGVEPGIALAAQDPQRMIWIRRHEWHGQPHGLPYYVVCGHVVLADGQPVVEPDRMFIDTGAQATGNLTAVVLEGPTQRFLHTRPPQCARNPSDVADELMPRHG